VTVRSLPTCTVVIPSRNCLAYLPTALGTVDMQRMNDLEVVIVDDGSSDGTRAWLEAGDRVRASLKVVSTEGVGVARARNIAIAAATSDLVAFLDADDQWWPGKLLKQVAWHRANPEVGMSFTDYIHLTPEGRMRSTCFEFWREDWMSPAGEFAIVESAEERLLATNLIGTSTVVARKPVLEQIGGFSEACKSAEDWDLWLRMAAAAPVGCYGAVTMSYLMRPNGETAARERRLSAMADIIARYEHRRDGQMASAFKTARGRLAVAEAEALSASGRPTAAARAYCRAMMDAPSTRLARDAVAQIVRATVAMHRTTSA
jgi:glycosyltransferase involved in cell wall biosynthesis